MIFQKSIMRCTFLCGACMTPAKVSTSRYRKNCAPEFLILSAFKQPLCGLMAFIVMNSFILTEGRNFKKFFKENYATTLDSCYIFTKKNVEHGIEHDVDSAYRVYIHYRHF